MGHLVLPCRVRKGLKKGSRRLEPPTKPRKEEKREGEGFECSKSKHRITRIYLFGRVTHFGSGSESLFEKTIFFILSLDYVRLG